MPHIYAVPSGRLSTARRVYYSPASFSPRPKATDYGHRFVLFLMTLFFLVLVALPTGATAYAVASFSDFESVAVMREQVIPVYNEDN